jgi:hypothetical protein
MLRLFTCLVFISLFISCVQPDHRNSNGSGIAGEKNDSALLQRPKLIEELRKLERIIATNDPEKIATLFEFPIPDSTFSIYVEDSVFHDEYDSNGRHVTREMFFRNFKDISASILVDQANNLFRKVPLDSLLYRNKVSGDAYHRSEPCYYSYDIEVVHDTVTLSLTMNSNQEYKSNSKDKDETPENDSSYCEHNFWWTFRFDGQKLHLIGMTGAD